MYAFDELENMARNALKPAPGHDQTTIRRWQKLFKLSRPEAVHRLEDFRNDLSRHRISDQHWDMVRVEREASGFDREAYEYSLSIPPAGSQARSKELKRSTKSSNAVFYLKLERALDTAEKVRSAAGLPSEPEIKSATDDAGDTTLFAMVNADAKEAILRAVAETGFRPTFVRISKARKALSDFSWFPTLGLDTTLPQFRPGRRFTTIEPKQKDYPVWYFFYGTLADRGRLTRLLSLDSAPELYPVSVAGGAIRRWHGTYKALVDAPETARVDGWAYEVQTQEHEDALLYYETEAYEVVRCHMMFRGGKMIRGLTFRFVDVEALN